MRRSVWVIAAVCCGAIVGGCGKNLEPTDGERRTRGKGDAPLVAQLEQLKTFTKAYVLVSQYTSCDEACMNQVNAQSGGILGASDKCCTSFTPKALTAQTFGGACPAGLNAVTTQAGGIACQVRAGGHVVYMPKDCDPFADNANEACGSGTCGMDGYCQNPGGTGREVINYQNQAKNLHPELKANSDYHKFNEGLSDCTSSTSSDLCGAGVEDVFASQWWPQAKDGIAWRWVPGATQGFENFADAKTLSPAEKYDVVFSNLSTACADEDKVTVAGKTFCPVKVKCGTNKCEKKNPDYDSSDADSKEYLSVSCTSDEAEFCVNYGWAELQDGCPDNPEEDVTCNPVRNPMTTVVGPATKWELENHGNYQNVSPDSWWGHCNGWASYATAEALKYPKEDICVKLVDSKITRCTSDATQVQQCGDTAETTGCMLFRMGDIEAMMSEVYFSDAATFTGKRCNVRPDDIEYDDMGRPKQDECRDINAGTLHVAVTGMLGTGVTPYQGGDKTKLSFVIDHNWDYQVWNFPLVKFQFDKVAKIAQDGSNCDPALPTADEAEAAGDTELAEMLRNTDIPRDRICAARAVSLASNGDYSKLNPSPSTSQYVMVSMRYWMVSDGVSAYKMMQRADQRGVSPHETKLNYVLELDGEGKILGGEWTKDPTYSWGDDSKEAHPDFLWAAIKPAANGGEDDLADADNKYMNYLKIKALLQCANDASTCAGEGGGTDPVGETEETILELNGESVARGALKDYPVTIPEGATKVMVYLTPTEGDPDLMKPCNDWKYNLEAEECTVLDPEAASTLLIQTKGYKASNSYNLKVVATVGSGGGDNPPPPPPPPPRNICCGHEGGSVTVGNNSCYCDDACSQDQYSDCCQDDSGSQGAGRAYVDGAVCQ